MKTAHSKSVFMRPKEVHTSMQTDYLERRHPVELHPTGIISIEGQDYETDSNGVCAIPERFVEVCESHGWEVVPGQGPTEPESKYGLGEDGQYHRREELPLIKGKDGAWYPKSAAGKIEQAKQGSK